MPNATVRANARALPEATNRRAVLGAVLAVGAAGATAILPAAASSQPQLSSVDLRVLDLWRRRARLQAISDKIGDQITAAEAQMPTWARSGPKYVLAKGERFIPGIDDVNVETVGLPEVADLDQQPVNEIGKIIARPGVHDLLRQFHKDYQTETLDYARRKLTQALIALDERLKEQEAEEQRTGYAALNTRSDEVTDRQIDIENEIQGHSRSSILALAATLVIEISHDDDDEHTLRAYRASLAAIRPQLVGAIAADTDRVLAEAEEDA